MRRLEVTEIVIYYNLVTAKLKSNPSVITKLHELTEVEFFDSKNESLLTCGYKLNNCDGEKLII